MPNDLSIKPVAAVTGGSENPAEPQSETFTPPAHGPPTHAAAPIPNPQLRLDAALGLVVIEFRDASGSVTTSIPSQRQLEAYRMWQQNRPGTAPGPAETATGPPAVHASATGQD